MCGFVFFISSGYAQHSSKTDYTNITHYTTADGLAESSIWSLHQDRDGFLWIGTTNGISKFDGSRFYDYHDEDTLRRVFVARIIEDDEGTLYFKLRPNSIWKYKDNELTEIDLPDSLDKQFITSLYFTPEGELVVGTFGYGIYIRHESGWKRYSTDDGLLHDIVAYTVHDEEGNLLLMTGKGISRYRDGKLDTLLQTPELPLIFFLKDKFDRYWFNMYGQGIYIYENEEFRKVSKEPNLTSRQLVEDENHNIWAATLSGLRCYDPNTLEEIEIPEVLAQSPFHFLLPDREGNMWAGSDGNGLYKITPELFTSYTTTAGLPGPVVRRFTRFGSGLAAALAYHKLLVFDDDLNLIEIPGSLSAGFLSDSYGSDSLLYFSSGTNIYSYDGERFSRIKNFRGESEISGLTVDAENVLWFVDPVRGIYKWKETEPELFYEFENKWDSDVFGGFTDSKGNLWFTAYYHGLFSVQGDSVIFFNEDDGFTSTVLYDVTEDEEGNIWAAEYHGIHKIRDNKIIGTFTSEDGLPSNECKALHYADGMLYIGTTKGLSIFDGHSFTNYNSKSGLAADEISLQGLTSDKEGNIYIGTRGGFSILKRSTIERLQDTIRVFITGIEYGDTLLTERDIDNYSSDKVKLSNDYSELSITFSVLTFYHPEAISYRYKLYPDGAEWQNVDGNELTLSDLSPGDYELQIGAQSIGRNFKSAILHFQIEQPFYLSAIFIISVFAGFSLISLSFYSIYRKKKQKKLENKYKTSKLENGAIEGIISDFISVVENEKLYLQAQLNISMVAGRLGIRREYLSQAINTHLKTNFNDYINRLRVEEAKRRLADPKHDHEILFAIALDVGFNNKTTFNAAFKKFAGMPPGEYRKSVQNGNGKDFSL